MAHGMRDAVLLLTSVYVFSEAELSTKLTDRRTDGRTNRHDGYSREAGKRVEKHQVGGVCTPTRNAMYIYVKTLLSNSCILVDISQRMWQDSSQ